VTDEDLREILDFLAEHGFRVVEVDLEQGRLTIQLPAE